MTARRALFGLGCVGLIAALVSVRGAPLRAPASVALGEARFSEGVAHVGSVDIALAAIGRGSLVAVEADVAPTRSGDEVHLVRAPGVVEWWRSLAAGMEQGVTIDARPEGDGPLVLEMSVGAGITAEGSETITLRDDRGEARATYSALSVVDREGDLVPSRMFAVAGRIRIEVEDEGAAYPLIVDPLVITEEAAPVHPTPATQDLFGSAVALSADGTIALVGSVGDDSTSGDDRGSVHLFRWTGAAWTPSPIAYGIAPSERWMGLRVDVAADGTRAITMSRSNVLTIFRVEAGGLVREDTIVSPCRTGISTNRHDGPDVAISDDGARIVLGHWGTGGSDGCAYVYARTGATWTQEASFRATGSSFGTSVAISGDGSRIAVAAPDTGGARVPRVEVYSRAATTWSLEATVTVPVGPTDVAMDATGTRFVVSGADSASMGAGVYVRSETTWSREGGLARTDDEVVIDAGGSRVALLASGGGLEVYRRSGTTWTLAGSGANFGGADEALALAETGRILVGLPTDSTGGMERGRVRSYTTGLAVGDACVVNGDCTVGSCADGFCCATSCGGGAIDDCQACSAALTGGTNGACAPLSPTAAPTVTCRAVASACDRAEVCSSASIECPANTAMPRDTVCGPSAGPCDREELCDGTSLVCAANSFLPPGTACGGGGGDCTTPGMCTGSSANCAGGTALPSSTVCLPAGAGNPCDLDDHCDGVIGVCVPTYAVATTVCGDAPMGDCDAPNHCSGTSADCEEIVLAGVVCRDQTGECDEAEICVGDSRLCPDDGVLAAGLSCRVSSMSCDPAEVCDGASAMCPADVVCDAGVLVDSGIVGAEPTPTPATGCSCRVGHAPARGVFGLLAMLLMGIARRRRR